MTLEELIEKVAVLEKRIAYIEEHGVLPVLQLECSECGGGRYRNGPCEVCNTSGYMTTDAGDQVLYVAKNHLLR